MKVMPNGVKIPLEKSQRKEGNYNYGRPNYSEYIVYNVDQVRLRYLVHIQNSSNNY